MLNLAIVEDDREYRDSFKEYFSKKSEHFQCVFSVESVEKFHKYYNDNLEIDIVLLDVKLPGMNGVKAIPSINRLRDELEIIMLTGIEDTDIIFQAITSGASGYLLKNLTFAEVEKELLNTLENGAAISPEIARKIIKHFQPSKQMSFNSPSKEKMNAKELQIIQLLVDGRKHSEIATMLGLSINGIKYHVKNIYRKLQVKSKSELIKSFFKN